MAVCSFCSSSVWSEWEFVYSLVVYCLWVASPVLVLDCSSPAVWCFLVATTLGVGVTWAGVWRSMLIHRRAVNKAKQCNSCVWISSFFSCIYLFVNVRVTGADLFYNFFSLYIFEFICKNGICIWLASSKINIYFHLWSTFHHTERNFRKLHSRTKTQTC